MALGANNNLARAERRLRVAGSFIHLMAAVGAFVVARIARDSLFLSRFDISKLPAMYVWTAVTVSLAGLGYARLVDRGQRVRLVLGGYGLLLAVLVFLRLALGLWGQVVIGPLYVAVEVVGALLLVQFWTFTDDLFDTREARRQFGVVAAGGVSAALASGLGAGLLVRWLGTENLLLLSALLVACCLAAAAALARRFPERMAAAPASRVSGSSTLLEAWSSSLVRALAWLVLLTFVVVTVADYQFKVVVRYHFLNRELDLATFLSLFQAAGAGLCLVVQLGLSPRLLRRSLAWSLALLPLALLGGSILVALTPSLLAVIVLKGADNVLRYSMNDAAQQVLFVPLPARLRGRAKTITDGIVRPLAQGATGLSLAAAGWWAESHLGWLAVISATILVVWLQRVSRVPAEYLGVLSSQLPAGGSRSRRKQPARTTLPPRQPPPVLTDSLATSDESAVLQALEVVPLVDTRDWRPVLRQLLEHPSAQVRLTALQLQRRQPEFATTSQLESLLGDGDWRIRAEAAQALGQRLGPGCREALTELLQDPVPQVQAATVASLLAHGGLAGAARALPVLLQLYQSPQAIQRRAAARAIGLARQDHLARDLLQLFADSDPGVRSEAIDAAGRLGSADLVLPLLALVGRDELSRQAEKALAGCGAAALPPLRSLLRNGQEPLSARQAAARILGRLGGQDALDALAGALDDDSARLRAELLRAITRLLRRQPQLHLDQEMLRRAVRAEIKATYQLCVIRAETTVVRHELLHEHLDHEVSTRLGRIFRLLATRHPGLPFADIYLAVNQGSPVERANAVELLEQLLDEETASSLVPMVESQDVAHLARVGARLFPLVHQDARAWLEHLLRAESPWLVACATDALGRLRDQRLADELELLAGHEDQVVRETAANHLLQLLEGGKRESLLERLASDPSPLVRKLAAAASG